MAQLELKGGAYQQASVIAGAQRCVNLYPEQNTQSAQSPTSITHYPRPGLTPLGAPPNPGRGRGLYVTTLGDLYAVVDQSIYWVDPNWNFTLVGSVLTPATTPVIMADNSTDAVVVDGSAFGSQIALAAGKAGTMTAIDDPNFYGSVRADFLDYFLIFNEPGTPNWYSSPENALLPFNGLQFGTKTAWPDNVQAVIANERQAWVLGKYKSELWSNAGLVPFAFQILSGNIVEYGLAAVYGVCKQDTNIYFISQSPEGARMAMRGTSTGSAQRITTHAIEEAWLKYPTVADCICTTYQFRGHPLVEFHFPTADKTWAFDDSTKEWHEVVWTDPNGGEHRSRALYKAFAYGVNVAQDWTSGQLYLLDETNFTDNGVPCVYRRGFPHLIDSGNMERITVWKVIANMDCGSGTGVSVPTQVNPWSLGFNAGFGPQSMSNPPLITLRVSRDRGHTFYSRGARLMGAQGKYNERPTFNRIGMGTDFVFELAWAGPMRTALNSVFLTYEMSEADE